MRIFLLLILAGVGAYTAPAEARPDGWRDALRADVEQGADMRFRARARRFF